MGRIYFRDTKILTENDNPSFDSVDYIIFPYSVTWISPVTTTGSTIECWGGGGAGGGAAGWPSTGGSGAGGTYARKTIPLSQNTSYVINIGQGGTSSILGAATNGGDTWFGTGTTAFVLANGGGAGEYETGNNANGAGGLGITGTSIGDIIYKGGDGTIGNYSTSGDLGYNAGGGGAAGYSGEGASGNTYLAGNGVFIGGDGGAGSKTDSTAIPQKGKIYGGGGSGSKTHNATNRLGGNGANGAIKITF